MRDGFSLISGPFGALGNNSMAWMREASADSVTTASALSLSFVAVKLSEGLKAGCMMLRSGTWSLPKLIANASLCFDSVLLQVSKK